MTHPAPNSAEDSAVTPGAAPEVEVFFDGGCSLCSREIALLRRLDRRDRVLWTDIDAPGFDASPLGTDRDTLMRRIHGRLPGGEWIEGVEVFRRTWSAIGLGWLVPLTRLPGVRHLLDGSYVLFARWRYARRARAGACPLPNPQAAPSGDPSHSP